MGKAERRRFLKSALGAATALALPGLPAWAQTPGVVRAQGQEVTDGPQRLNPLEREVFRDPAEDMRQMIQNIAAYARSIKRDFQIIPMNVEELTTKDVFGDGSKVQPAVAFLRAIDGMLIEGPFAGRKTFGEPTEEVVRDKLIPRLEEARRNGLTVLSMDYADDPTMVGNAYADAARRGFVPFVAYATGIGLNRLPTVPRRPWNENGDSVIDLGQAKNFIVIRDPSAFGRQDQFALTLHRTNYDVVVVEPFHRRTEPLSAQAIETLKYKQTGARRLVLAHVNIGAASSYLYYWRPDWREGSPRWIDAPTAHLPDSHWVHFWEPEWQNVLYGNPQSFLYGLIRDLGFDGVILDGTEVYRYYDGTLDG